MYIRKHKWRVDSIYDTDDLLQEARLLFYKLAEYYPRVIDPPHFMALYKRTLSNFFHDQSRLQQERCKTVSMDEASTAIHNRIGEMTNAGYALAMIESLPAELRSVLDFAATERVRLKIRKQTKRPLRERESLNNRLIKKLNLDLTDPSGDLRRFLQK
jgi:DNA-directed RNA polymerase specialized sigma24 family protein